MHKQLPYYAIFTVRADLIDLIIWKLEVYFLPVLDGADWIHMIYNFLISAKSSMTLH